MVNYKKILKYGILTLIGAGLPYGAYRSFSNSKPTQPIAGEIAITDPVTYRVNDDLRIIGIKSEVHDAFLKGRNALFTHFPETNENIYTLTIKNEKNEDKRRYDFILEGLGISQVRKAGTSKTETDYWMDKEKKSYDLGDLIAQRIETPTTSLTSTVNYMPKFVWHIKLSNTSKIENIIFEEKDNPETKDIVEYVGTQKINTDSNDSVTGISKITKVNFDFETGIWNVETKPSLTKPEIKSELTTSPSLEIIPDTETRIK